MFNLITHKVNDERSDYLYTHFLLETNRSAPFAHYSIVNNFACSNKAPTINRRSSRPLEAIN